MLFGLWKSLRSLRFIDIKRKWAHIQTHTLTHTHTHAPQIIYANTQAYSCTGRWMYGWALPFFYAQLTQLQVRHAAKQTQRLTHTYIYTYLHTHTSCIYHNYFPEYLCTALPKNNAKKVDEGPRSHTPAHTHTSSKRRQFKCKKKSERKARADCLMF